MQLAVWSFVGFWFLQSFVSASILVGLAPRKRGLLLAFLGLMAGAGAAVTLAWLGRVDEGLPFLPDLGFTVIIALFYGVIPAFAIGLACRRHLDSPRWGRIFRGSASALFTTSAFLGVLALSIPLHDWFHSGELQRAKRFVEAMAVEVGRASKSAGRPATDVEDLLPRLGNLPPLLKRSPDGLACDVRDGVIVLHFIERPRFMKLIRWTYRVPAGPWERKSL